MHPFASYEVARGIVDEMKVVSERAWWFRDRGKGESKPLSSADTELASLVATEEISQTESIGS